MRSIAFVLFLLTFRYPAAFGESAKGRVFNVREQGAKGDGKSLDTAAIQRALDACGNTGGMVLFPPGTYLSQPLVLRTKTRLLLQKGAIIQATDDPADFKREDKAN